MSTGVNDCVCIHVHNRIEGELTQGKGTNYTDRVVYSCVCMFAFNENYNFG